MLARPNRITSDKDFSFIFKKGKFFRSKNFSLRILKTNLKSSRFGFVVSNKVSKKATERNKIKRRLRSVIEADLEQIAAGYDIVFIVAPKIIELDFNSIKEEAETALSKLKLLKNG